MSSLRSVVHRCFRPALTTAQTISYTTSVPQTSASPYTGLYSALAEESKRQGDEVGPTKVAGKTSYEAKPEVIRKFFKNKPIHPSHFSRERCVWTAPRKGKPWDFGLPTKIAKHKDVFHRMGINPLDECLNSTLLSYFVTDLGRIRKRAVTNLTSKTQRRLSKAIKRAKMMGILPIHNKFSLGLYEKPNDQSY